MPLPQILLQVQAVNTPASAQYRGLWDALRRIPQQEGGWRVSDQPAIQQPPQHKL
jgi:hypothetical protein